MKRWTAVTVVLIALGFTAFPLSPVSGQTTTDWVTLLDAAGMANWTPIGDANWHVEDGSVQADKGSGFLVSKESYADFQIRAEFWVSTEANSGIFIRCTEPGKIATASAYEVNIFDTRPDPKLRYGRDCQRRQGVADAEGRRAVERLRDHGQGFEVLHHAERHDDRRRRRGRQVPERADRAAGVRGAGVVEFRKVQIKRL